MMSKSLYFFFLTLAVVNLTLIDLPGLTKVAIGKLLVFGDMLHDSFTCMHSSFLSGLLENKMKRQGET